MNHDKTSIRESLGDLLKADTQAGEELRRYTTDVLLRLARSGAVHLESGSALPLPDDLLETVQARPKPLINPGPNWTDTGPFRIAMAGSVVGSNKGPAGFAAIITNAEGAEKEVTNWYGGASSQEADVRAFIMALEQIPAGAAAEVFTGNRTTARAFNEWVPAWKNMGWRNTSGQQLAGGPLWRWADVLAAERTITVSYVAKGEASSASRRAALLAQLALERAMTIEGTAR